MFFLEAKFTPKMPPSADEIIVIQPLSRVERLGAERVATNDIIVKTKNKSAPKISPIIKPFFFKLLAAVRPAKKAPMLRERVEQMLAVFIGNKPKDINKADKISKSEITAVPRITPKIIALIVLLSKNFLFSKIKTSP